MADRCPPGQCFTTAGRAYDQGSPGTPPMSERLDDAFSAIEELFQLHEQITAAPVENERAKS